MTLEEAKKILKKEGFIVNKIGKHRTVRDSFIENEAPDICEAMQVVSTAGYGICMDAIRFNERKARLSLELAENRTKGDLSGNKSIEHCGEPIPGSPLSAVEGAKLKWKDNQNTSEKPAIKESASQFNDALLDEQAKKIAEHIKENERLEDQITVLNACKKQNDKTNRKQIKGLGKEIVRLNGIIHDKNAILADVAEELRLTKIREKNLVELGLKYVVENKKLKKELANKTELVKIVRNGSKEYCDYGVAANEFIKELAHLYVLASNNGIINIEMLERCKNYQTYGFPANCNRETKKEINDIARGKENKKPRIPTPELSEEELMKLQEKACVDIAEEGADQSAIIVQYNNGITLSKEEAEIIERCTKNGTELHYSEKDGLTYTNMFGKEMPIRCLRSIFHVFTDEEIENMKK